MIIVLSLSPLPATTITNNWHIIYDVKSSAFKIKKVHLITMKTFVIQLEEAYIEIRFTSKYSSVNQETYYSAEAFVKEDLNSRPDTSDLLFTVYFVSDNNGNTVNYLKVENGHEQLKSLILQHLKDQIILGIEDPFKQQDATSKWTFSLN